MNPTTTGGVAITTAALGGLITWSLGVMHVPAPPDAIAGTMAAMLMYAAHAGVSAFKAYFPPKVVTPATPPQQ